MNNPLEQFEIVKLLPINVAGFDISFTNSALVMIIGSILTIIYILTATSKKELTPGYLQASIELVYSQIESMVQGIAGNNHLGYTPFIFSIFIFVMMTNLVGMFPYSFCPTSHLTVTFSLAMIVFVIINIIGFYKNGLKYFSILIPSGVPLALAPLMLVVELCAYLARPISLSLRLAANMIAGHIMIEILSAFVIMSGATSLFLGVAPFTLLTVIMGFEIFIALLQAYIFSILACVYLSDAINLH
jgi:F-type H+-transporting ATPase subunit a